MDFGIRQREVEAGLRAVLVVSRLARSIRDSMAVHRTEKRDLSPVSVADYAVQAIVARALKAAFPADPIVGEEGAGLLQETENSALLEAVTRQVATIEPGASASAVCEWIDYGNGDPTGRFWTLDPIDGTKGYLRGEQYAIALALIEDGKVQAGVLGCPNLNSVCSLGEPHDGVVVVAARGQGAWRISLNGSAVAEALRVSTRDDIADARMLRSVEAAHTNTGQLADFAEDLGVRTDALRLDSQAKYALLAAGEGDLLLRLLSPRAPDYREWIWDQAAGAIVVEEAGGMITDLEGNALDFGRGRRLENNRGICASNGLLHEAALEGLARLALR